MEKADEPAFPPVPGRAPTGIAELQGGGLTKRELFAAMALQGLMAANEEYNTRFVHDPKGGSAIAVEWADALLTALEQK